MQENKRNMSKNLILVSAIVVFLFFITEEFDNDYFEFTFKDSLQRCTTPKDCEEVFKPPNIIITICLNGFCLEGV
jgi:hypothetical protein